MCFGEGNLAYWFSTACFFHKGFETFCELCAIVRAVARYIGDFGRIIEASFERAGFVLRKSLQHAHEPFEVGAITHPDKPPIVGFETLITSFNKRNHILKPHPL